MHKEPFHFELFEDESAFATRGHARSGGIVVICSNGPADRDATKNFHVIADGRAKQTAHLFKFNRRIMFEETVNSIGL